ncbi:MAG: DNA primase [Gammaproteobacteria bacterium]
MAGRIPQAFIDELLTRTDIIDVIESRVPLKKAGREYKACCPFHNEKTPSFTVSQVKQFYHCFGCGEHGSAITFLMNYEHMEFVEAVEELAQRAGLEVPHEATDKARSGPSTQPHYALLEKVSAWYREQLRSHPQAGRAVEYLKQRGLTGEIAARFNIGYAPPGWENLSGALGSDDTMRKRLLELGLTVRREGAEGAYDRFRDRIMFPIHDRRGRTIAFGGRVLDDATPKYMNSPESAVFHKGQELYGLYEARKAVRHLERIVVVEGYMDVVALAQFGIDYAVATLGTATTREHLERLFRTVPEVVFCFDGDRAGRDAAWRALENTLPVLRDGREARFLFLPEGEDPDSLIRKIGNEGFEAQLAEATHLSDFFFDRLSGQLDMDSIDGRARLVSVARPLLARLPDGMFRQLMVERLAVLAHTAADSLAGHLDRPATPVQQAPRPATPRRRPPEGLGKSAVRMAIEILLYQPDLAGQLDDLEFLQQCDLAGVPLLLELLAQLQQHPGLNTGAILEHWRDREEGRFLHRLAEWSPGVETPELLPDLRGCLNEIQRQFIDLRINYLSEEERHRRLSDAERREYGNLLVKSHTFRQV